jgi:hypothetical protein
MPQFRRKRKHNQGAKNEQANPAHGRGHVFRSDDFDRFRRVNQCDEWFPKFREH